MEKPTKPSNETGIWLWRHEHNWEFICASRHYHDDLKGYSEWHPTFQCKVCCDVICDYQVFLADSVRFEKELVVPDWFTGDTFLTLVVR